MVGPLLSILDLSPVTTATSASTALRNTLDLARRADQLGYTRYWLAEHHNAPSVASTAPDIMVGQIAAATSHIRVGSGGVMIHNHRPLVVAERFKTLSALFPGRIDLGIGRAPGGDSVTSKALGRGEDGGSDDYEERLIELFRFETREFPDGHPLHSVYAMPSDAALPAVWLLGSTGHSAEIAASHGTGFAFAHHFAKYDARDAIATYRCRFRRSRWFDHPYAILAVHVICAGTDAEAERLAATSDYNFARSSRREFLPLVSPDVALDYAYDAIDIERIKASRTHMFVGCPQTVHGQLARLIEAANPDELMISSMIYDHDARCRSFELLSKNFGLVDQGGG
ncbi:LLM class flavin-dependent oxidoreductase [Rhizobium laguerreae]|uniref:LLM class flavin-dependent oxidoreductase n=1 Tax=Rhizobium laguerreae TaxID=1076926 RepID=UPI0028C4E87C|nr:LLM class flavin-dependent oxidoreductase [Rhizobium laguerreae]